MSGNTIGKLYCVTSFGESHGAGIGGVIDGCPPGIKLDVKFIQERLDKRRPGHSHYTTQRKEDDNVEILSGVFEGVTTGTPIGFFIRNTDHKSNDYSKIKDIFRPSHADYTYHHKYGLRDYRGGGRSSARETAVRVAAGAVAQLFLREQGVKIRGYLVQMGSIKVESVDINEIDNNPFFCPDSSKVELMSELITQMRREGNSVGARIRIEATGIPVGLGEPVFDKLDADLAHAMMSINAVKGVEIGAGFLSVEQKGSEHRDEISSNGFLSNNAGGILGGISSGQVISVDIALKPTSSLTLPGRSIDIYGNEVEVVTKGRHDPCVGVRATPIAEAMMAIVLMDHWLRNKAQNAHVAIPAPF